MKQQYLAQIQANDAPALVYPVLVSLTNAYSDLEVEAAVCKLAIASLVEDGHDGDDLDMIGCIKLEDITLVNEPPATPDDLAERICNLYPDWRYAEDKISKTDNSIDMIFTINVPESNFGNGSQQYHCYLSFDRNKCNFSGDFGYWTPNESIPVDNKFSPFKSLYDLMEIERLTEKEFDENQFHRTAIIELSKAVSSFIKVVNTYNQA